MVPLLLSTSIFKRLDAKKAISIAEKKAEKIKAMKRKQTALNIVCNNVRII